MLLRFFDLNTEVNRDYLRIELVKNQTLAPLISVSEIHRTHLLLRSVVVRTPLIYNAVLSERYQANIYLKREDLQVVRSYKIRGAYSKIHSLSEQQKEAGIVCASAGNHAQGVALSCFTLGIQGKIYMPMTTPKQKINQVRLHGKDKVEIVLVGDTFDDAFKEAMKDCESTGKAFIHPFDDEKIVAGQGTVAVEILEDAKNSIDYLFCPIGGGGLISGIISYMHEISGETKIIGVEPEGAPAMKMSIEQGELVTLEEIDKFVDGAAVRRVGKLNFEITKDHVSEICLVPEGQICTDILDLYNEQALVVEPAGALSVSALEQYREEIRGKEVVCIISGGNNDITRTEEMRERSLLHKGLKHYFLIRFPQRPGALSTFCTEILGERDDICHFEYSKRHNRAMGPAVVGVELTHREDLTGLLQRLDEHKYVYERLNDKPDLFTFLCSM